MIIPIRCFTCGKVLADKWRRYEELCKEEDAKADADSGTGAAAAADGKALPRNFDVRLRGPVLDALGITRICCRRHMLGHVDLIDSI